jgi:hypothetical protein
MDGACLSVGDDAGGGLGTLSNELYARGSDWSVPDCRLKVFRQAGLSQYGISQMA